MLSAVIRWESSYSALPKELSTTDTPGIPSSQSSRTRDESSQISTGIQDRDRAVLRRSEPSSRTTLTGEQPDPWDLLQPQDVMSRHRCHSFITKRADYTFILLGIRGASRMIKVIDFTTEWRELLSHSDVNQKSVDTESR